MKRIHFLAAEIWGYSFIWYAEKVEMGHERFTEVMPNMVRTIARAEEERWTDLALAGPALKPSAR